LKIVLINLNFILIFKKKTVQLEFQQESNIESAPSSSDANDEVFET
jgi:hypothetical protein